jgi:hypothetical protein
MNPKLWRAIDRVGLRKASRFEWEVVSGLPWSELSRFLKPSGGLALDAPDPDAAEERLAVWHREDGTALLESPEIPAHRPLIKVDRGALVQHRLDVGSIVEALAGRLGFIAHRPKGKPPLLTIGFVQDPGKRQVDVALFLPVTDPHANVLALESLVAQSKIVWVPTARWMRVAPVDAEIRDLEAALASGGEDRLVNVAAEMHKPRKQSGSRGAIIHVKPEDRWGDVRISFSLSSGTMRAQIGERKGEVSLLDRSGNPTNAATILGRVLAEQPPRWLNSFFPKKKGTDYRKAFQRFASDLQAWIPVNDGKPFREDLSTHEHHARFQCEPLIHPTRSRDLQDE